jgi:hypothetical protein
MVVLGVAQNPVLLMQLVDLQAFINVSKACISRRPSPGKVVDKTAGPLAAPVLSTASPALIH